MKRSNYQKLSNNNKDSSNENDIIEDIAEIPQEIKTLEDVERLIHCKNSPIRRKYLFSMEKGTIAVGYFQVPKFIYFIIS